MPRRPSRPSRTSRSSSVLLSASVSAIVTVSLLGLYLSFEPASVRSARNFLGDLGMAGSSSTSWGIPPVTNVPAISSSSSASSLSSQFTMVTASSPPSSAASSSSSAKTTSSKENVPVEIPPILSSKPADTQAPLLTDPTNIEPTPAVPAHRANASSSRGAEPGTRSALGCYDRTGRWTTVRSACALLTEQAAKLGILNQAERLTDEDFQVEADKNFRDAAIAVDDAKILEVRELLALTMRRIDEVLEEPGSGLSEEAALETKNWLEEQNQTLTAENAARVADEVPRRLRLMEGRTLFAKLDAVKDAVWNAFNAFNDEGVALPLEQLFAYQSAVSAVDDPACRYEGSSCAAITTFITTVESIRDSMSAAAIAQGKPHLLDLLQ